LLTSPHVSHELFEWKWHHFAPLGRAQNYLPILKVLSAFEGGAINQVRDDVNRAVHDLNLPVGLGKRRDQPHANLFRDRIDVWRFTGALEEPGLVADELRLTPLGRALLDGSAPFEEAMGRQARRLRFPRIRVRRAADLAGTIDKLRDALDLGPGVCVAEAWHTTVAYIRSHEGWGEIRGEEAARFLSGSVSDTHLGLRAEALLQFRRNGDTTFPPVSGEKERQGRELLRWLGRYGALTDRSQLATQEDFKFEAVSSDEICRWAAWWGSWPTPT
jgi:hypothetical protein